MTIFDDVLLASSQKSSSHHKDDDNSGSVTRIVGIVFYSLFFIATVANYIYKLKTSKKKLPGMATTSFICLPVFMLLRVVWLIIELIHDKSSGLDLFNSVLNRVCMCVFLFVFISLLFYWIDTVHTTVNTAYAKKAFGGGMEFGFLTPLGRLVFYLATGLVILLILVLMVARAIMKGELDSSDDDYSDKKHTVEALREANNMIISVMFLILGGCFLFYGTKLNCLIGKGTGNSIKELWKTELFSIGLCLCFILRFFFFSWSIFGGSDIEEDAFIVCTYYIPEIIPAALILWSVNTPMFSDKEENNSEGEAEEFVDPLLEEERDDESRL